MQHIGMVLQDERGQVIEKSDLNFVDIIATLLEYKDTDSYPLLRSVDPYGDTIFNIHQISSVIQELDHFASEAMGKRLAEAIKKIIEFMSKAEQHTYIRLVGD